MPMAERWADSTPPSDALVLPLAATPTADPDFATFYRRELPRLVTLAAAIAGTAAAEEIAQEALLRAHRSWHRISGFDKPGALSTHSSLARRLQRRRTVRGSWHFRSGYATRYSLRSGPPEI